MDPPLAQGIVPLSHHLQGTLGPTQPLSQFLSNTQIYTGTDINPGFLQEPQPHIPAPKGLGILETFNTGQLIIELSPGGVNNGTGQHSSQLELPSTQQPTVPAAVRQQSR